MALKASDLDKWIGSIRIDTAYGPPIVLDRPFAPVPATAGPSPLKWLKPQITIVPAIAGMKPIVSAPWGAPGPTRWPQVQAAVVGVGALALGLLVYGAIRALR